MLTLLHKLRKTLLHWPFTIRKRVGLITVVLLSSYSKISAQASGQFLVRNFDRRDFNASISNLNIAQDEKGRLLVANYDGLLIYDGKKWKLISIQNNLIATAVASDSTGRIFVGTQGDFGYLIPDSLSQLKYYSLGKQLPRELDLSIFWDIFPTSQGVFFHSPQLIVRWKKGTLSYWKSNSANNFRFAFKINDTLVTVQPNENIKYLLQDSLVEVPNTKKYVQEGLAFIEGSLSKKILLGTNKTGFYTYSKSFTNHVSTEANSFIKTHRLYTAQKNPSVLTNNKYAIGTLTGGILILDNALQVVDIVNKEKGLISDVIKDVYFDSYDNLWVATNEGIAYIELSSPWHIWKNNEGLSGGINIIKRHKNNIYIGTSEGLFQLNKEAMQKISGINSKVWDIAVMDSLLYIGSQEGLFQFMNDPPLEILDLPEVTHLSASESNTPIIIIGDRNGTNAISFKENAPQETVEIELPNSTFVSSFYNKDGNLWASAKFNGVYKITNFLNESPQIIKYDTTHGLPDINEIQIIKKDNRLLFTTTKGFYHFNEKTERFEPDSSIISERLNINNIAEDKFGNYIISVVSEDRTAHVEMLKKEGDKYVRDYIPFRRLPEMEITAIYPDGDKYIWIGGSEGLFRFDRTVKKDYTLPFNTLVSKVSVRDSVIFYGNYYDDTDTTGVPPIVLDQPDHFKPELEYKDNNLTFEYAAAFYEAPERTVYSYYLENNESGWSKWTSDTKKEYNNLSAGTYTFHVKAKNIYDTEGRIASYEFTILPPWYQTVWAYIGFSILGTLFIWFIALLYTFRVRMQRRRLKLIVADRTYEVIQQKKEIERQKDLLQHQYEEICNQRDSIQQKNRELQVAQNETLSANEALQKLNNHLEKEVEKRTEKIKQTLQQLQNKNKELDTFIYRASHDLKGPISRISGLSTLAKMAVPPDADQNFVALIEETANNMKVLISKLTQVHDLNNAQIRKDSVRIAELVASARHMLSHLEKDGNIEYSLNFPEDLEAGSDKDLLGIIIQNLLENALVFRKPRGVEHQIRIEITVLNEVLTIKIYDTGIGIYPEQIDRVFEMFYKGVNQSIGSGLGLYLVKMTVEKLNGTITVQSKIHEYTEFTVMLPLSDNDAT